jgi:predicted peroxiredoxin
MDRIAMILTRPPYGDVAAAEAVRHALGAASQELSVDLILLGGGVNLARKGQDDAGTGYTNLESSLNDCIEMGVAVHAEATALARNGVAGPDLLAGVAPIGAQEIARLVQEARWTMIF